MLEFIEDHFKRLSEIPFVPGHWTGQAAGRWAKAIIEDEEILRGLPDTHIARQDVRAYCRAADPRNAGAFMHSDEQCFLVVAAWGGMRRDHARAAWASRAKWIGLLADIRRNRVPRAEAFRWFHDLRMRGGLPNIRAAYFTKFIFFLREDGDGYIMDQWTSKSMNLLTGAAIRIDIDYSGMVSDRNDYKTYERYCAALEALSARLGERAEESEERIFSGGGRVALPWRAYVRDLSAPSGR